MHEYLIGICICFSYVCHIPIELNGGGLRPPPYREGGTPPPSVMESIKFDGNVANVKRTSANAYQIFVHLDILWMLWYFPYVVPGAIYFFSGICSSVYIYIYPARNKTLITFFYSASWFQLSFCFATGPTKTL